MFLTEDDFEFDWNEDNAKDYEFIDEMNLKIGNRLPELKFYLDKVVERREQYLNYLKWMAKNTGYFYLPASMRFHCSMPHGLLIHSMNVCRNLLTLNKVLGKNRYSEETCVLVALNHDAGKSGWPTSTGEKQDPYIKNEPTEKQKAWGFVQDRYWKYNENIVPYLDVPHASVYLLMSNGVPLSTVEYQSILIHDGQFCDANHGYATKESELALLLHFADCHAGFVEEPCVVKNDDGKGYHLEYPNKG